MSRMEPTADTLQDTFPACDDAPLASALVRHLARGEPVTAAMLAAASGRTVDEVAAQLARWPNVERDADDAVIGFSGLTLRPTAHSIEIGGGLLHAWCAWDTLFLPGMLGATAHVRSACAVSGRAVDLVVAPDGVKQADPRGIRVSFPPLATTDTADITVLDLAAAFELGCRTTAPLTASSSAPGRC